MRWHKITGEYHRQTFPHEGRLSSLPEEWQRELAALWRVESDVNNGAYLQFLCNWGRESYVYASQALKRIGARKMAEIIDYFQALVDEHFDSARATHEEMCDLMSYRLIGSDGKEVEHESVLPERILERIYELSYEFMGYPDNIEQLGLSYYQAFIDEAS